MIRLLSCLLGNHCHKRVERGSASTQHGQQWSLHLRSSWLLVPCRLQKLRQSWRGRCGSCPEVSLHHSTPTPALPCCLGARTGRGIPWRRMLCLAATHLLGRIWRKLAEPLFYIHRLSLLSFDLVRRASITQLGSAESAIVSHFLRPDFSQLNCCPHRLVAKGDKNMQLRKPDFPPFCAFPRLRPSKSLPGKSYQQIVFHSLPASSVGAALSSSVPDLPRKLMRRYSSRRWWEWSWTCKHMLPCVYQN